MSNAVWCPVSVLCSNVELVLLPGHLLTGLLELGCPRMCAVSCECCVVIVCLFDRQDSCVTGLLVLVCPRTHHYNTATPCTPHILGQPNSSSPVKKMSWQMSKHSMTTQHTQVTAHILGQLNTSSPIKMPWRVNRHTTTEQHTDSTAFIVGQPTATSPFANLP